LQFESLVHLTPSPHLKLQTDFTNYSVDWKDSEVRPFKSASYRKLSVPSNGPISPTKKSYPPNSLVFSTGRPPSPTKQSPTLQSTAPESNKKTPGSPTKKEPKPSYPPIVNDVKALYAPGSVYTLNQTSGETTSFVQYDVEWNGQELQGKAPQNEKPTPIPMSPPSERPIIRTNNFTISPSGVITYHD
jgi:hypothetical protein